MARRGDAAQASPLPTWRFRFRTPYGHKEFVWTLPELPAELRKGADGPPEVHVIVYDGVTVRERWVALTDMNVL